MGFGGDDIALVVHLVESQLDGGGPYYDVVIGENLRDGVDEGLEVGKILTGKVRNFQGRGRYGVDEVDEDWSESSDCEG